MKNGERDTFCRSSEYMLYIYVKNETGNAEAARGELIFFSLSPVYAIYPHHIYTAESSAERTYDALRSALMYTPGSAAAYENINE